MGDEVGEVKTAALHQGNAVGEVAGGMGGASADGDDDGGHAAHERIVVHGEDVLHAGLPKEDDPAFKTEHLRDLVHGLRLPRRLDDHIRHRAAGGLGDRAGHVFRGSVDGVGGAQGPGHLPGDRPAGR